MMCLDLSTARVRQFSFLKDAVVSTVPATYSTIGIFAPNSAGANKIGVPNSQETSDSCYVSLLYVHTEKSRGGTRPAILLPHHPQRE